MRLNKVSLAISYIEDHLHEPICINSIADASFMSVRSLQRNFSASTGYSVKTYLRGRRLTEASKELVAGGRVLDTAVKYQFDSYEGFSRSFKRNFLLSPDQFKKVGSPYNALHTFAINPELDFADIEPLQTTPKLVAKEPVIVTGIKTQQAHYALETEENRAICRKAIGKLREFKSSSDASEDNEEWSLSFRRENLQPFHMLEKIYCVQSSRPIPRSNDWTKIVVPKTTFAVFNKPKTISRAKLISTALNWLRSSAFFLADAPCMYKINVADTDSALLYIPICETKPKDLFWWKGYCFS